MGEHNKETVRRWIEEVWATGNAALIDDLVAEDMRDHNPIPGLGPGREARKQILAMFHAAFDIKMSLDLPLHDGDYVIDRWTATLTHKGEFMGIAATGKTAQLTGIDISRLADGKIAESWHQEDVAGLMQQLSPPPTQRLRLRQSRGLCPAAAPGSCRGAISAVCSSDPSGLQGEA